MYKYNIVVGADPEMAASVDGISVIPYAEIQRVFGLEKIGGDDKHPIFWTFPGTGGDIKIIGDGVAFELTVPPNNTFKALWRDCNSGFQFLSEALGPVGMASVAKPVMQYDVARYLPFKDDPKYKMGLIFGCDPDDDVWGLNKRSCVKDAILHPFRYFGGHIHLSGHPIIKKYPRLSVKAAALGIGTYVTANSVYPDLDKIRVSEYGTPGRFRVQMYGKCWNGIEDSDVGIEYRTPSCSWLASERIAEGLDEVIKRLFYLLSSPKKCLSLINSLEQDIIRAVMNYDMDLAKSLQDVFVNATEGAV